MESCRKKSYNLKEGENDFFFHFHVMSIMICCGDGVHMYTFYVSLIQLYIQHNRVCKKSREQSQIHNFCHNV